MIATLESVTPEALSAELRQWMTSARWFTGEPGAEIEFGPSAVLAEGSACTELFVVHSGGTAFAVPLTFKNAGGSIAVYDATDDADGQAALLGAVYGQQAAANGLALCAHPIRAAATVASAKKLTSEQSNTSIIYRFDRPDDGSVGIILKVFRVLSDGSNPDVELQGALDSRGSRSVPRQYGSVSGTWAGTTTHLLAAQEFLAGATDAWQVITRQLGQTASFTQQAEITALGRLTREIHDELAQAFPTVAPTDERREELVSQWRQRADAAIADAPALAPYREQIEEILASPLARAWPAFQRIHGDFHLGQVLHVPDRGWVALDFEGEPLRPLSQRVSPDLALRDVAGMLRSFDYAGGSAEIAGGDPQALAEWTRLAQAAFMAGYGHISEEEHALLDALILDKALYEVSYEAASRPTWLDIPVRGVLRLIAVTKP
ncbi:phosphotransferase [Trueperella pyogenes]|uniref:phosphotransferase n=1 Tax=Trueperella pyogenes TaxID=1661 RepID=UPI00324A3204